MRLGATIDNNPKVLHKGKMIEVDKHSKIDLSFVIPIEDVEERFSGGYVLCCESVSESDVH